MGPLYAGVSYLEQHGADDQERSFTGLAASMDVSENLYLAITYQDIEDDNKRWTVGHLVDYDQSSAGSWRRPWPSVVVTSSRPPTLTGTVTMKDAALTATT